jgi:uncharacterized protein (DUF1330 family)
MPAYLIVLREGPVRDAAALAEYQRKTRENPGDFRLKPLVVYGATQALEGEAPEGTIVLEFPSVEEAKAWYNSPSYQAALPYRLKSADYRAFIVDGLGNIPPLP